MFRNLDLSIENLTQSFEGGFEYFALLVQVFASEFRSAQNHHLKNFFIIVPPLTLNFIEHIIMAKERLAKKASQLHQEGYMFSDDGFAIGFSFTLYCSHFIKALLTSLNCLTRTQISTLSIGLIPSRSTIRSK